MTVFMEEPIDCSMVISAQCFQDKEQFFVQFKNRLGQMKEGALK